MAGQSSTEFTARDRGDLEAWAALDRRVSLSTCEFGVFAMLYPSGTSWASWGIVRQERSVLVWDCVTLADIGRFPTMVDALAVLPAGGVIPIPSVLPFAARRTASG